MIVLALDTTTGPGGVALWENGTCHAQIGDPSRKHGARLPGDLLALLAAHRRTLADVTRLAIVSGPGSFTGLRVGVAAIQGLAVATGCPVVPVTTFEALVAGWTNVVGGTRNMAVACQDAQRGDVFLAAYDTTEATAWNSGKQVIAPLVIAPGAAAELVASRLDLSRIALVGDAATRYADVFAARLPGVPASGAKEPLAASAARLAAHPLATIVPPGSLQPMYLRRPDVELARERRAATTVPPAAASPAALTFDVRRAFGGDDLAAVETLQHRTFTNPWGAEAIRWELEHTDVARLYLMTGPHGGLVAYCACWMIFDELHINSLAVDPDWRRQGLARRLLQHVFRDTIAAGAAAATLEVRQSNEAARALYEGLGFSLEGRRRDYYQQPREDALILWNRRLPASLLVAP